MEKKFERRDASTSSFFKSKDESTGREVRTERETRDYTPNREFRPRREGSSDNRRSYNPNFTDDNRVRRSHRDGDSDNSSFRPRNNYNRSENGNSEGGYRPRREGSSEFKPRNNFNRERSFGNSENSEGGYRPRNNFNRSESGSSEGGFRPRNNYNRSENGGEGGYRPRREGSSEFKPRNNFNRERSFNNSENNSSEGGFRPRNNYNRSENGNSEGGFRPRNNFNRSENGGEGGYRPRNNFNRSENGGEGGYRPRNNFNRSENGGEGGYRPRNNFNRSENGGEGGYRPRREGSGEFKPRNNFNGERSFGGSEGGYRQNRDSRPFNNRYSDDNRSSFNSTEGENTQPEPLINREIRLNRYIAMSGICSRREADTIIAEGLISVNEEVVTELGTKIKMTDVVKHNGEVIRGEKKVYIVMNKPKGFITTVEDIHAERTVIDLLKGNVNERVYPVGRLDKNTMGVLLLTNDGDLTKALTHPSYNRKKIYHVFLDKNISEADMERIAQGVELEDGIAYADEISIIGGSHKEIGIEIHNGRNRIVRRLFEHFGYKIMKLDRVYFAGITKKGLQRGFWRHLTTKEVQQLYKKS